MTIQELREKRVKLVADARTFLDEYQAKCKAEKRDPTAEERTRYDTMMEDVDKIKIEIDGVESKEADEARTARLAEEEEALNKVATRKTSPAASQATTTDKGEAENREFVLKRGFRQEEHRMILPAAEGKPEFRKAFNSYLQGDQSEYRAIQKDSDVGGGYLSAPQEFMATLIQAVDNAVFMRQIGNVLPPLATAASLGAPSLDNDPADPTWVSELDIGTEDTTLSFGMRELNPHPLAQFAKISKTLIRRSTLSADTIVRDRLAYKASVVVENAYMNGSGSNQPLGVFTASANGVPTSQDVSTGNTTTEMRFDGLKNAAYQMKGAHRSKAEWIFHRDAKKQLSKLKDGEGRYIWQPGVIGVEGDTLLGRKMNESEYAPNTFTTGLYVGILGNFEHYWIVDALSMSIQVLMELYAAANKNGYLLRLESDGMPVLAEAFVRVKLA